MKSILSLSLLLILSLWCYSQVTAEIENLGPTVNSQYDELAPVISADGKNLYFVIVNHPENSRQATDNESQDIWYSHLGNDGKWSKADHLASPLNQLRNNTIIWVSSDGNKILIAGYYEDGKYINKAGVSICTKTPTGWSLPRGQKIKNYELMNIGKFAIMSMSNDSKTLLLSFSEIKDSRITNLYFSILEQDGSWSEPKTLGKLFQSKEYSITGPFLASDNVTLYFSSDMPGGYGGYDIWMSKRVDDSWQNWSQPINLGAPINTPRFDAYFSLDATGNFAYMASNFNSLGRTDIVKIKLRENMKPNPVVLIYGNVYNNKTKVPVSANLLYETLPDGKNAGIATSSAIDGSYKIILPYGKMYSFRAAAENFIAISENTDLTKVENYKEIKKDLFLAPIEKGQTIRLNSIFFDPGKSLLRAESFPELGRLLDVLQNNPKIHVEIAGHTDNIGEDGVNLKLSNERAKAVTTYLNYRGIAVDRITPQGYGKTKPVATNSTEEGRQLNRRVEFTIL